MEHRITSRKSNDSRIERSQASDLVGLVERSTEIYDKMLNYASKCKCEHIIIKNNGNTQIDSIVNELITAFKRNEYI